MLRFGKHRGKLFEETARDDPRYCAWVLSVELDGDDTSRSLMDFATYLRQKHGGVMTLGVHKWRFFDELRSAPDFARACQRRGTQI